MNFPLENARLNLPAAAGAALETIDWAPRFGRLPGKFYTRLTPTALPDPYLVAHNPDAMGLIGLDAGAASAPGFTALFAGNHVPAATAPLAAVYAGHQFGVYVPQLGDGRAITIGEAVGAEGVQEVQLKGAGPTPYSRMGDGRAVLRSSIREYLCSEAMHGLGIPTTRALAITGSDYPVIRETVETAAVVTRLAPSFVRFGSFEYWYHRRDAEAVRALADFMIDTCYPELTGAPERHALFLREVVQRTARLMAQWQSVGFMHGVMNTDNMSILGLTLDYGPFGFMEAFDPNHICNHTDQQGRYSYANQPQIGHWNCYALAQALMPLIGDADDAQQSLAVYQPEFKQTLDHLLHAKLGLVTDEEQDSALFDAMFKLMAAGHVDFTHFFRQLGNLKLDDPAADAPLRDMFIEREAFDGWATQYRERLRQESSVDGERKPAMDSANPKYVLRNYLAQVAIEKAQQKDYSEIAKLLAILERPFDEQPENESYAALPPDWASHLEVSCSS